MSILNESVRHFTTREILRCVRSHGGSRLTVTDTTPVPGTKSMRWIARYTFCGECRRHVKTHPTCDECGRRRDAYMLPFHPWWLIYAGIAFGWFHAWVTSAMSG